MSRAHFGHLHTHSHYSLLEALPKVDELVKAAKTDGHTALALTDNGNMYAAIEFYKECTKAEIKPIIGVDFYVAPRTRHDKEQRTDERHARLVLLAHSKKGYQNLIELVSKSHLEGFFERPRIDRELIEIYREGLLAILPALGGEHALALDDGAEDRLHETLAWYAHIFPDHIFTEISMHPEIDGHDERMKTILAETKKLDIPPIATHECSYLKEDDALARELVDSIRLGRVLNRDVEMATRDLSFHSRERLERDFAHLPEALDNVGRVIEMCDVTLDLGAWVFPNFPTEEGKTHDEMLRERAYQGFVPRGLSQTPELITRLDYELSVIAKKGYSPYFLVVADLLRHARENGILTNIRGSVAGSLVTYLSYITNVNPIEYNLPFERFLNPERPSAPDIDMDYADNRRDDMIDYVRGKYGESSVAQIGTFGTMLARAAVRDVSRALGYSYGLGDAIAKMIPFPKQGFPVTIDGALESVTELKETYNRDADAREILDLARRVEGNARHVGIHAAGVVIAPSKVTDFVPVQLDPKGGKIITQYDMHAVEDAGLLKFDFLGLTNLSILADARERVKTRLGIEIDFDTLPLDDKKTFEMLSRGETLGVFQLAGGGMTNYLVSLKPSVIHDINAMVALYRPGPMNFIPHYIERKHNPHLVTYLDPRLEPILKNSYGIITYQDDVLEIAIKLAGYSWLEADKFRKAMGKKIVAEMAAQKEKFEKGCLASGTKPSVVQKLWEQIETFAAYGFNKAHAASYGNLAYKTAYMKAHYPVDYMAAILTADAGDVEKIAETVHECSRMGLTVLPPSVNESRGTFTVVTSGPHPVGGVSQAVEPRVSAGAVAPDSDRPQGADASNTVIRFGLYSIKNFGTGVADSIIAERERGGIFASIGDFVGRVSDKNLNKKSLEALIMSGALDALGERAQLLANTETLLTYHREQHKSPAGLDSLFGSALTQKTPEIPLTPTPPAPLETKLAWEKELLGFYISGHPLDKHRATLDKQKMKLKEMKAGYPRGAETVIAGFLESTQSILTKKGERMLFGRLSDFTDNVEIVVFPRTLQENATLFIPGTCIMLKGKFSDRNGEASFVVERVKAL